MSAAGGSCREYLDRNAWKIAARICGGRGRPGIAERRCHLGSGHPIPPRCRHTVDPFEPRPAAATCSSGNSPDTWVRKWASISSSRMVPGGGGARAMSRLANAPADGSVFYAATPSFIFTSLLSSPANTFRDLDPLINLLPRPGSRVHAQRRAVRDARAGHRFGENPAAADGVPRHRDRWNARHWNA